MPTVPINGFPTYYQQAGQGPDVVLIHAFTSNVAIWILSGIVDTLAADFRVTAYDLRGHGASSVVPSGYTSPDLAADFQALHQALGLGPAYLVGHSYGGVVAVQAALDYPDIVAGVVLSDTYFPGLRHLEPDMGQAGPWQDLRASLLRAGQDIGPTVDFPGLIRTVAGFSPAERSAAGEAMGPPAARWLAHLAQLAGTTAADDAFQVAGLTAERICAVGQPVVALYDEHSPFQATCDYLAAHLRHCRIDVVPGARHLAPLENSAGFGALVRQHLLSMVGPCGS